MWSKIIYILSLSHIHPYSSLYLGFFYRSFASPDSPFTDPYSTKMPMKYLDHETSPFFSVDHSKSETMVLSTPNSIFMTQQDPSGSSPPLLLEPPRPLFPLFRTRLTAAGAPSAPISPPLKPKELVKVLVRMNECVVVNNGG